jgi:hypothetical protein
VKNWGCGVGGCPAEDAIDPAGRSALGASERKYSSSERGWAETKAAYRLLDNPALEWRDVLEVHTERTAERMREHSVVLCLQDTTELDFTSQPGIADWVG